MHDPGTADHALLTEFHNLPVNLASPDSADDVVPHTPMNCAACNSTSPMAEIWVDGGWHELPRGVRSHTLHTVAAAMGRPEEAAAMREALARPGMDVLEFSSAEARERVMQLLIRSHRHGAPQGIHCQRVVMGLASLMAPEAVRDAVRDLERGNEVELLHWPRWGQRDNRYHALDGEDRYLHVEGWEARAGVRGDRPECLEMAEAILRQAAVGGEDELLAIRIQEPLDAAGWTTGAVFEAPSPDGVRCEMNTRLTEH